MIELFGIPLGTAFQGGTLLTALLIALGLWIKGMPERRRAANEEKVIDNNEAARQFREWRAEVHAYKNEVMVLRAELQKSNAQRARNRDRFNMVLFILRLVMAELRRIDPASAVIKQADALLEQVTEQEEEDDKSSTVRAAEHTVEAAQETLSAALSEEKDK